MRRQPLVWWAGLQFCNRSSFTVAPSTTRGGRAPRSATRRYWLTPSRSPQPDILLRDLKAPRPSWCSHCVKALIRDICDPFDLGENFDGGPTPRSCRSACSASDCDQHLDTLALMPGAFEHLGNESYGRFNPHCVACRARAFRIARTGQMRSPLFPRTIVKGRGPYADTYGVRPNSARVFLWELR
jgi:hypothetical protein